MRTLFLCLILAGLAWVIQPAQNLQGSTVVLLGLIVVGSLASVRVAHKLVLPAHLGPLAAGFLLRPTGLLPESLIDTLLPFSDLASVWLGLYLGTTVTSSMLLSRRSLYAALVAVAIPAAITALLFLLFFRTGPIYALQLAFLSAVAAPLLTHLSAPTRRNALAFSLLVTILALLFWSALVPREIPDPESILLGVRNILLWLAVVELSFRTLVRLRTPTGFYVFYGLLALFLYTAATLHGASPLLLAVGTGLFLSVRCGKNRDMLVVLPGLSSLVAPFVVAYFVARLDTSGLHLLTVFHSPTRFLLHWANLSAAWSVLASQLTPHGTGYRFFHRD